jgi:lysyl-tRNA synthetase class 1
MVSQIFTDEESIAASLRRSGHYAEGSRQQIRERLALARNWAEKYAPEESRINLDIDIEKIKSQLDNSQKKFLNELAVWLEESNRTSDEIHEKIYLTAKGMEIPLKGAFAAIYLSIMGTERGPRASTFIASLDKKWVVARFRELFLPL